MRFLYKKGSVVKTEIFVDYANEKVNIVNYTDCVWDRAFGVNEKPSFSDFEAFLEDRCFPRARDRMKMHLRELGLDCYEPMNIVKKTNGRLEGDPFSLEVLDE